MKREWSGCERRRCSPAAIAFPTARRCVPRRRVCPAASRLPTPCPIPTIPIGRPARPNPPSSEPGSRSRRAGPFKPRHRQATPVQAKGPCARCRFATALPPARRWARPLSGIYGRCHNGPAPQGPVTDARTRQGRRVGLRPGQGVRLAPPGAPADCRVHAGSASRSSGVMRASTALRTSGPALCSMALQSAILWMVATMPRIKS